MFKRLVSHATLLPALGLGLLVGCSNIPHDEDSLYVHGFIAPLGETRLTTLAPGAQMYLTLKSGDTLISKQKVSSAENWPSAYKLEFHPPQLEENEEDLILRVEIVGDQADTLELVYQKTIKLDEPELFGSNVNILVTPFSIEKDDAEQSDEQKEQRQQGYAALFESFSCENNELKAALQANFIVINNEHQNIVPRVASAPATVYKVADASLEFHEGNKFNIQKGDQVDNCQLNEKSYQPWQEAQALVKAAEEKQIESDKKASSDRINK